MKIALSETALARLDWAVPALAMALWWGLMRFVPPGVALALMLLTVAGWTSWRNKRRTDPAAAKAYLRDYVAAFAITWGVAWTLVLFMHPAPALFIAFCALGLFKLWRETRTGRMAA